jgi:hypothetical protein
MAIDYYITLEKECISSDMLHETIKKIRTVEPIVNDLGQKGFVVHNTLTDIGLGYALIDTKDAKWGWEPDLFQKEFWSEQYIGFRMDKSNLDKAKQSFFFVFFDLLPKIPCDLIAFSDDIILFQRNNNAFYATKDKASWIRNNNFFSSNHEINVIE